MDEELSQSARSAGSGAQAVNLHVHVPKENIWKHPAIYAGILAVIIAFWAEREARLSEYYAVDVELCLLKKVCPNPNGVLVPADPWGHSPNEGSNKK